MSNPPKSEWLTFGEVKRKIEACIGSGEYTLRLWTQGDDPVLPRHYLPGRTRAVYSRQRVDELLQPMKTPSALSRP